MGNDAESMKRAAEHAFRYERTDVLAKPSQHKLYEFSSGNEDWLYRPQRQIGFDVDAYARRYAAQRAKEESQRSVLKEEPSTCCKVEADLDLDSFAGLINTNENIDYFKTYAQDLSQDTEDWLLVSEESVRHHLE